MSITEPLPPPRPHLTLKRFLAALAVVAITGGAIWGFLEGRAERDMEAERERPVNSPQRLSRVNDEPIITLDAATLRESGFERSALATTNHRQQVRAYGSVLDLQQFTDLANSISSAKSQLLSAEAKAAASKPAFDRATQLNKNGQIVSTAQMQTAEAAFHVDEAAVASAQSQIRTSTATAYQAWGPVLGKALVERTDQLTRLIGRQDVLLQITVPPGESLGEVPVTAFAEIDDKRRLPLTLVSAATKTDPRIQGVSYFYAAPFDPALIPGMNVLALLPSDKDVEGVIVPKTATVWWQGKAWLYLATGANTFTRREIATGQTTADNASYVVTGLPKDVQVVTKGAQALLSEEFRAQVQVGEEDRK